MDAARYARVRDLFLAVDELPKDEQSAYLEKEAGDDQELLNEVLSLLDEHDPESARIEGESAKPVGPGMMGAPPMPSATGPAPKAPRLPKEQSTVRPTPKADSAQVTQFGAQRTHASPRHKSTDNSQRRSKPLFLDQRTRRNRRWNSGWLWLAAVLPTAIIGWLTYRQVAASLREAVTKELSVTVNTLASSTQRFLDDKSQLVESWSRQPELRKAISELVEISKQAKPIDALKAAPQTDLIRTQLQELSGFQDVKFVVWNREGMLISSWLPDRSDFGIQLTESGARNHIRVFRGQSVLFGPARLKAETDGFTPETTSPVMANIVPVHDNDNNIIAALLVRGIGTYEQFDQMFRETSVKGGLDAYAVNSSEVMITNSMTAQDLASKVCLELDKKQIATNLRVTDPGEQITPYNLGDTVDDNTEDNSESYRAWRKAQPLTIACAAVTNREADSRVTPYNNYAGIPVVGSWHWNRSWEIGIIVERNYDRAFAPARIVRFGFLILGALLTITAFAAASQIAKQSAQAHAAVHPLGRYELVGELGSGGMGVVYRARHKQLGRDVALKVLRSDRRNREDRLRFDREAKLAASLSNPHSVSIYDYGHSDDGEAFCVMEFLKGITLYEATIRSGPQNFGRTLFILRQICDSLSEAHAAGLLHRDVKPQNVMLSFDPSVGDWAVLFDFGLAKPVKPDAGSYQTSETVWAGTPMYMAPERYRDPGGMDPRSDIYSIGCIAYFLISGRPPYIECDPESLFALVLSEQPISMATHRDSEVPQDLVDLVDRCMAKSVDDRFATAAELSNCIDALREQYPWTTDEARSWWEMHGDED